jgi:hypothetical protein
VSEMEAAVLMIIVSCGSVDPAPAPKKPRPAATSILRIEQARAEPFAKPLSLRRLRETKNDICDIIPLNRMVPRTPRELEAEFVDHGVVRAFDLIGRQRVPVRPIHGRSSPRSLTAAAM